RVSGRQRQRAPGAGARRERPDGDCRRAARPRRRGAHHRQRRTQCARRAARGGRGPARALDSRLRQPGSLSRAPAWPTTPARRLMNRREFVEAIGAATALATAEAFAAAPPEFDPVEKSIAELSSAQAQGRASAESLTQSYLRRIERYDRRGPALRAVLAVNPQALEAARALDAERRAGRLRGPLHGIPLLIKDNVEPRDTRPMPRSPRSCAPPVR